MTAVEPKIDTITVHNPADGRIAGSVPIDDAETVAAKARELRLFQPEWEAIGAQGRKKWMLAWQGWILDNAGLITEVLMSETGKSRVDANIEATVVADGINYWAGHAEEFLADSNVVPHSPLYRVKEIHHRLPAAPANRCDHPVELPLRDARPGHPGGTGGGSGGSSETN